ncbi:hypothetical protein KQ313_09870 [Synechococcus sp. CS-1325]|uniref:hypothetical protein n=1 Tax=Synechococcus sp. CS-1325 TaxID=2847979 RepID=UPI000DB3B3FC|nr:hypothetical protein [Synechococcus sp. CS-1325]MCT0199985.1 hypothetical protein [Synechococcus sp. CS-1325]PZU96835.1 MAG: hypothetical protein DCF24_13530 [Cyanobium sp.]
MTAPNAPSVEVALFQEATETAFAVADQLHHLDGHFPKPPRRHGVANADEISQRLLGSLNPISAMSLDEAIGPATTSP